MGLNPFAFRIIARIVAMGYAIPSLIIFPVILAWNQHWDNSDYLYTTIGFISIIGLFIGLKWQGLGGLISAFFPLWVIIRQGGISLEHKPEFGSSNIILRISLLLCIPCIFYSISWFLSNQQKRNQPNIGKDALSERNNA